MADDIVDPFAAPSGGGVVDPFDTQAAPAPTVGQAASEAVTGYLPKLKSIAGEALHGLNPFSEERTKAFREQVQNPSWTYGLENSPIGPAAELAGAPITAGIKSAAPVVAAGMASAAPVVEKALGVPPTPYSEYYQRMEPGVETALGLAVPKGAPVPGGPLRVPEFPESPFGVTLTKGERLGDLAMRQKEQAALRSQEQPAFAEQRQQQLDAARENLRRSLDPQGQLQAETPAEAGQVVSNAVIAERGGAKNIVDSLYEEARMRPGEVHAGVFEGMPQQIRGDLTMGDREENPIIVDRLTPYASRMLDYLDDEIGNLRIRNKAAPIGFGFDRPMEGGPLDQQIVGVDLNGIDRWRKNLSSFRRGAFSASQPGTVSEDARATQLILDNFDRRITDAINNPATFTGDQEAVNAYNRARQAYSDYRSTFTPQGRGDAAGRAVQKIVGDPVNDPLTPSKVVDTIIGSQGATGSIPVANRLKKILGEDSPEWAGVRQATLQRLISPLEGELDAGTAKQAQRLSKFLNSDMANAVYNPDQQGLLRDYANFMRQLTMPAGTYAPSEPAIRQLGKAVAQRIGGLIGAVIGHAISPFPIMGELAGYTLGKQAETMVAKRFNGLRKNFPILADAAQKYAAAQSRIMASEAQVRGVQAQPKNLQAGLTAAGAALAKALKPFDLSIGDVIGGPVPASAKDQSQIPGGTQQREAGGRVEHKGLATKTQANYRGGNGRWACGWCTMFIKPSSCSAVRGHISPKALCDYYEPEKGHERLVDNRYDVVTGANSSKKRIGPIYIDRHIPEWSPKLRTKTGKRVRLWTYLSIHEDEEQRCMEVDGDKYDTAHQKAEAKEKAALEKDGGNWKQYSDEIDRFLKQVEHEKVAKKPPMPLHVKPEQALDHHKGKHRKGRADGGSVLSPVPDEAYGALSRYAQGAPASHVHGVLNPMGWSANLRSKNGVELTDPSGKIHYVPNGDF